jgi:hypothetical protein
VFDKPWFEIGTALVISALAFFGKRELSRIDQKVDKADFAAALKRIDDHIADDKAMRAELTESLATMNKTLTETQVSIARIVGRLEAS